MTWEDQVFIANVMFIDPTWKLVALNVIGWPVNSIAKLNTITKIHKYKRFHEGHQFILMAMEMHDAPKHDMGHFIKECAYLLHDRQLKGYLSLFLCF